MRSRRTSGRKRLKKCSNRLDPVIHFFYQNLPKALHPDQRDRRSHQRAGRHSFVYLKLNSTAECYLKQTPALKQDLKVSCENLIASPSKVKRFRIASASFFPLFCLFFKVHPASPSVPAASAPALDDVSVAAALILILLWPDAEQGCEVGEPGNWKLSKLGWFDVDLIWILV